MYYVISSNMEDWRIIARVCARKKNTLIPYGLLALAYVRGRGQSSNHPKPAENHSFRDF